ncbi:hypothetical protein FRC08_000878 [Ceratobasidium sp. 394]|nr:hypothetical protein FRC08_000878 [Ceratobasidium sp. 394]
MCMCLFNLDTSLIPTNTATQAINALPIFHGKSKELLRPFIKFYFGFTKPATTPDAIAHNVSLADKLLPNTFHCLAYDLPYSHYEGEALSLAIAIALFGMSAKSAVLKSA